jgi:TP901 family phage tail tape measure protein
VTDRSIVVRLRAEISDFKAKMGEAAKSTADAAKGVDGYIQKNKASINAVSNQVGLLGAAMTGVAVVAVKKFADFDQAMSNVAATGDDARGSIDALRDAALDAGQRTVFSATESANAIENLEKAGVSASDILGGALNGALDLAAAGGMGVADAAETAATALTIFKLSGDKAGHVADLLAAGAGKAQGSVADLSMALKQGGLVAAQTGLSIEETTGGLAAFASAGLIGSDAGTSFKTMLQRLTPQSQEAQQAMHDLHVEAYDGQGQFIGLAKYAGVLQQGLQDLTPEARNAALATIFGSDAVRAASVVYDEGAAGIQEWIDKVDDQGYAAETAATRLDNLKGDVEQLGGALDSAFIGAGEGADGPLRSLTQEATNAVNAFADLPAGVQQATLSIIGGGGLVLLGVAGLGKLTVGISEAKTAMQALGISAKTAGLAAAGVGAALAVATLAVTSWASAQAEARARTDEFAGTLDEFGQQTGDTLSLINKNLSSNRNNWIDNLIGHDPTSLIDTAKKIGLSIKDLQGYIVGNAEAIDRVNKATADFSDNDLFTVGQSSLSKAQEFKTALDQQASALTGAQKQTAQKALADKEAADASDELGGAVTDTTGAVVDQTDALGDLVKGLGDSAGVVLSVRDAQRGLEAAYDDASAAIEKNGATLDITTEAGRENQTALDGIAQSGWDLIDSMKANGSTQEELQVSLQGTRDNFISTATQMGLTSDEASALADQLGLIPANVQVTVVANTEQAVYNLDAIGYRLDHLDGRTVTTNVRTNEQTVSTGVGNTIARAGGGPVYGPGTGTSDSIHALLSNGEYVVKADAVQQYGRGFFDQLNAQRFASGGAVGMGSSSAGSSQAGMPQVQVTVERVVEGTPQDIGREVTWALAGRRVP